MEVRRCIVGADDPGRSSRQAEATAGRAALAKELEQGRVSPLDREGDDSATSLRRV
jgi:hypothetical protein